MRENGCFIVHKYLLENNRRDISVIVASDSYASSTKLGLSSSKHEVFRTDFA